jgi:hypothetical protein
MQCAEFLVHNFQETNSSPELFDECIHDKVSHNVNIWMFSNYQFCWCFIHGNSETSHYVGTPYTHNIST